ncbi:MAG: ribonuclease toxin HepT-like protein [Planctomycetota bacterium]
MEDNWKIDYLLHSNDKEWHKTLLYQMAHEVPQVRPAVMNCSLAL